MNYSTCRLCKYYISLLEKKAQSFRCKKGYFNFTYAKNKVSGQGHDKWLTMTIYKDFSSIPCENKYFALSHTKIGFLPYEIKILRRVGELQCRLPGDDREIIDTSSGRDPDACQEDF